MTTIPTSVEDAEAMKKVPGPTLTELKVRGIRLKGLGYRKPKDRAPQPKPKRMRGAGGKPYKPFSPAE